MREIKFRYWNEQGKGYHYNQSQVIECLSQQVTGIYDHEKDGCIFEQFTGLKDKNGKEIYEGDIVKRPEETTVAVEWNYAGFEPFDSYSTFEMCEPMAIDCEVIGNIHENPELLKEPQA